MASSAAALARDERIGAVVVEVETEEAVGAVGVEKTRGSTKIARTTTTASASRKRMQQQMTR